MAMNDKLFAELMASIEEAGHIVREETAPSRTFTVEREPLDVVGIREGYKLSQTRFAALLGISVKTLRNWEQGRRTPAGPARILLQVAAKHPDAVWDVVHSAACSGLAKPACSPALSAPPPALACSQRSKPPSPRPPRNRIPRCRVVETASVTAAGNAGHAGAGFESRWVVVAG